MVTNNIYGPVKRIDWISMREIRRSVAWMKQNNEDGGYDSAIEKEQAIYDELMALTRRGVRHDHLATVAA